MTLKFHGKATHTAYPENGLSPAHAVGELLRQVPEFLTPEHYTGMVLCTVIGVQMGEKAFGAAAAYAEVWLTLRAEHEKDLELLRETVWRTAKDLAGADGLGVEMEEQDVFPSTENDPGCAAKVIERCNGKPLEVSMRWSEDFGHYLKKCKGAFFGIGAGKDHPALHTITYEYPDDLLEKTAEAFWNLI
ncbi:peptidase dimerization domain-containing protein [Clostridiaceae bacterium Marseille-Q4145]|nr:peptidase dimerization domain-containing protein [Clostridiaceae bacterium Marseille-Q4145]